MVLHLSGNVPTLNRLPAGVVQMGFWRNFDRRETQLRGLAQVVLLVCQAIGDPVINDECRVGAVFCGGFDCGLRCSGEPLEFP